MSKTERLQLGVEGTWVVIVLEAHSINMVNTHDLTYPGSNLPGFCLSP
jgi:hypothetical protein